MIEYWKGYFVHIWKLQGFKNKGPFKCKKIKIFAFWSSATCVTSIIQTLEPNTQNECQYIFLIPTQISEIEKKIQYTYIVKEEKQNIY